MSLQHFTTLRLVPTSDVAEDSPLAPPSSNTGEGGASSSGYARAALLAACMLSAACSSNAGGSPASSIAGASANATPSTSGSSGSRAAQAEAGALAGGAGAQAAASGSGASSTGKLSFATDVYDKVIRTRCGACHNDAQSFGSLQFFPGAAMAYANLVGVPAGSGENNKCRDSGLVRVQPGDPEHSLLYLKLTQTPCGSLMPPRMFSTISPEQIDIVRQWIADGAAP